MTKTTTSLIFFKPIFFPVVDLLQLSLEKKASAFCFQRKHLIDDYALNFVTLSISNACVMRIDIKKMLYLGHPVTLSGSVGMQQMIAVNGRVNLKGHHDYVLVKFIFLVQGKRAVM